MRKNILILTVFFLLLNIFQISSAKTRSVQSTAKRKTQEKVEDKWLGLDKFGHFFISGFIAGSAYSIYHESFNNDRQSSTYFAGVLTLSLGVGKEISDSRKPRDKFSYKDLIFDVLGISAGIVIASR